MALKTCSFSISIFHRQNSHIYSPSSFFDYVCRVDYFEGALRFNVFWKGSFPSETSKILFFRQRKVLMVHVHSGEHHAFFFLLVIGSISPDFSVSCVAECSEVMRRGGRPTAFGSESEERKRDPCLTLRSTARQRLQ
jgi:hypothetical protein